MPVLDSMVATSLATPEVPDQLRSQLAQLRDGLRPGQQAIADWQSGPLAVSAVPGAGKSTGMAVAAAIAIARNQLNPKRQLIVVTFTRSAAANIKRKIRENLKTLGLPAGGFMVQTLHGLAWAIARGYPEFSAIDSEAVLITPNQSHRLIKATVERWIAGNPALFQVLLEGRSFDGEETERLRRQAILRTEVLPSLAYVVIHEAKSSGLTVENLLEYSQSVGDEYNILTIAAGLYEQYQEQLQLNNWIDYDEMILAALRVLENPEICQRWQSQCFAVFEDEAQDSSPLQTKLLEILAATPDGNSQNLVRVGDPNQAINSTFTPADPIFFREFCDRCSTVDRLAEMTQAGRSTKVILDAANYMLAWTNQQWQQWKLMAAVPFRSQQIQPVGADDPQPNANPAPAGLGLEIHQPADIEQSIARIGQRVVELFAADDQADAAILVRTNEQGRWVTQQLRRWHGEALNILEVGERDRRSHIPAEMLALLQFIDRPHSPDCLKAALTVLLQRKRIPSQDLNALVIAPEQFLYPLAVDPELSDAARAASRCCTGLLKARMELPTYQLLTFLAYALEYDQTELATADKLAERIFQQVQTHSLEEVLRILSEIVGSEQFEPVNADEMADYYARPGQLTVITMHKAKGLDWDCVFIPFLNEAVIPGKLYVPPQIKFLGELTLAEVARGQIRAIVHGEPLPDVIQAWERAGALKTAEEFRLLYVAMTRAKKLLWLMAEKQAPFTWGKPDNWVDRDPCPAIPALAKKFPRSVIAE